MRKLKLYNSDKTKYIDLQERENFASNWQGLGLDYDLSFKATDSGEYLDSMKIATKDIKADIHFPSYTAYEKFRAFVLANGKNPLVLEYETPNIQTAREITLKNEDIIVKASDDEYFVHVPLLEKYFLKSETVPFKQMETIEEIIGNKYAEVRLLTGNTIPVLTESETQIAKFEINSELKNSLYQDDNGVWRIDEKVGYIEFTGNEPWARYFSDSIEYSCLGFRLSIPDIQYYNDSINVICNKFQYDYGMWIRDVEGISGHRTSTNIYLNINKNRLVGYDFEMSDSQKIGLFKNWLQSLKGAGNPVWIKYEFAVPKMGRLAEVAKYLSVENPRIFVGDFLVEIKWKLQEKIETATEEYLWRMIKPADTEFATYVATGQTRTSYEWESLLIPGVLTWAPTKPDGEWKATGEYQYENEYRRYNITWNDTDPLHTEWGLETPEKNGEDYRWVNTGETRTVYDSQTTIAQFHETFRSRGTVCDELTIIEGEYKKIERISADNEYLSTEIIKEVEYSGGLSLYPGAQLWGEDENNLIAMLELQYKAWNHSDIILKINYPTFTISGDDLILFFKSSDLDGLSGDDIVDKVRNYLTIHRTQATILLATYITDLDIRRRDVFLKTLSKGEKNIYHALQSELIFRPVGAWYRDRVYDLANGVKTEIVARGDNTAINLTITAADFRYFSAKILDENDTLLATVMFPTLEILDGKEFALDSVNKKITLDGYSVYHTADLSGDTFLILPAAGKYFLLVEGIGEGAEIIATVREWV